MVRGTAVPLGAFLMYVTMLVLSVVVFIAVTAIYLRQPNASILHPATFYLLFHGLVFVIRPIFGWFYEYRIFYDAAKFTPSVLEKSQALICTNLAFVVFMATMMVLTKRRFNFKQDQFDLAQRSIILNRFWLVAIPLGALGLYSIYWLITYQASGEMVSRLDTRTGWRAMEATNGYFYAAGALLAPIVAIIAFLGRFRLWSLAPFAGFVVLRFATGSRGDAVAAAVMLALLFMYDKRRKWPTFIVVAGFLAAIPLFDSILSDRGAGLRQAMGYEATGVYEYLATQERVEAPLETRDLSALEMVEYLVWAIPKRSGSYDYFLQNLQVITEPIPRALWPEKPVGAPIRLFDLYSHAVPIGGVLSIPGAGWMYWGFAGVIIWSAIFASIYAGVYNWFAHSRQSNLAVIGYVVFLSTAVIAYRDGIILTILKQLFFYIGPLVALILICRATGLPSKEELRRWWVDKALQTDGQAEARRGPAISPQERRRGLTAGLATGTPQFAIGAVQDQSIAMPRLRRRARATEATS
jgi:hypothetical protein